MSEKDLLLPDLTIRGFRGLDSFTIPHLGRVTLLTGGNGVGKTSVLEAVRIYASRGRRSELERILDTSDEISLSESGEGDKDDKTVVPDWPALFYGRRLSDDSGITIGPANRLNELVIESSRLTGQDVEPYFRYVVPEEPVRVIRVISDSVDNIVGFFPQEVWIPQQMRHPRREPPQPIICHSTGPGLLNNTVLAQWWDNIALTSDEARVKEALSFVTDRNVDGVVMVGESQVRKRQPGRLFRRSLRPLVKFSGEDSRVPLRSLGDGALRLFSTALALANSRDGFLLVDEAENGLHYSIQRAFWRMVLQTAHNNNVQVIATTQSFDCIRGFTHAAKEFEDIEGRLVRLSRQDGNLEAIDYSEEDLVIAAERSIEVR